MKSLLGGAPSRRRHLVTLCLATPLLAVTGLAPSVAAAHGAPSVVVHAQDAAPSPKTETAATPFTVTFTPGKDARTVQVKIAFADRALRGAGTLNSYKAGEEKAAASWKKDVADGVWEHTVVDAAAAAHTRMVFEFSPLASKDGAAAKSSRVLLTGDFDPAKKYSARGVLAGQDDLKRQVAQQTRTAPPKQTPVTPKPAPSAPATQTPSTPGGQNNRGGQSTAPDDVVIEAPVGDATDGPTQPAQDPVVVDGQGALPKGQEQQQQRQAPGQRRLVTEGKVNLQAGQDGDRLTLSVTDGDSAAGRPLGEVILGVRDSAKSVRGAEFGGAEWSFLGDKGSSAFVTPPAQRPGVVWPGYSTEKVDFAALSGPVRLHLEKTAGPGEVKLFTLDAATKKPTVQIDTGAGVREVAIDKAARTNTGWVFTEAGSYDLSVRYTAKSKDGRDLDSGTQVLKVLVGQDAIKAGGGKAAPAPSTPAPSTPETATEENIEVGAQAAPAADEVPVVPVVPSVPVNSGMPAAPVLPAPPGLPASPGTPASPGIPASPGEPVSPAVPVTPGHPAFPGAPAGDSSPGIPGFPGGELPYTGGPILSMLGIGGAALAAGFLLFRRSRKSSVAGDTGGTP